MMHMLENSSAGLSQAQSLSMIHHLDTSGLTESGFSNGFPTHECASKRCGYQYNHLLEGHGTESPLSSPLLLDSPPGNLYTPTTQARHSLPRKANTKVLACPLTARPSQSQIDRKDS